MESLQDSPGVGQILDGTSAALTASAAVGTALFPPAAPALAVMGISGFCLGLFRKAWKFGKPSVEQMIENIEAGADCEFQRIWEHLDCEAKLREEFLWRLQSQEAEAARLSALFHGLRTSDPEKHARLGCLTVNCIYSEELETDNLDNMMRAAVELTEFDVALLRDMYQFAMRPKYAASSQPKDLIQPDLFGIWQDYWHDFPTKYPGKSRGSVVGGFGRLSALGMIYGVEPTSMGVSPVAMNYWITEEGARFHRRIHEIQP